jgi:hypothetical protein
MPCRPQLLLVVLVALLLVVAGVLALSKQPPVPQVPQSVTVSPAWSKRFLGLVVTVVASTKSPRTSGRCRKGALCTRKP